MGKFIKLLLGLTLLLIMVVAVAVVGAILYFDPNDHKDFIVSKVETATGRTFAISGDIDLTFYPWLGLEADGITLGNAQGFGKDPFLHAEHVALRIKTLPLFKKQYELDTLRLHGLALNLAKNKEGITNWDDLAGGEAQAEKEKKAPLEFAAVILGGVDIRDARMSWQDATTDQTIKITDMDVTTGELTYGAPINLTVGLKAEANKPAINSDLKLQGILNYNLDTQIYSFKPIDLVAKLTGSGVPGGSADLVVKAAVESNLKTDTVQIDDMSVDVLGTSINGVLTANRVSTGKPDTNAQLSIKSTDLARILQLVDPKAAKELARLNDRSADIKLNLSANMDKGNVQVSQLDARLLGATIQGNVDASNLQSNAPAAKGMLKATGPDLPALIQVAGQFQGGEEPGLKEYGQRLSRVTDKSFDVSAEFDADFAGGNVRVPTLAVKMLGITANGQLDAKGMKSNAGKVAGKFTLHGEKLAPVLTAFDQKALGDVLQVIDIDAGVSGTGQEIVMSPLAVNATFSGKQIPNSPASVSLKADATMNLEKETLVVKSMKLQGPGLDVNGNVNASKFISGKPSVTASLDTQGKDLALVFKLAGIEPLATQLAGVKERSFAIKTSVDADLGKGSVKVSNLDARLLGAVISGDVDAANIQSKTPSAKGKLKATGPDLPALLQVIGQFQGGDKPALKEYGKRLASVTDKKFDITTNFDADLKSGDIKVPELAINTLGITANGQLDAKNITSSKGKVDGKLSLRGEKISKVLAAFGQAGLGEVLQSIKVDAGVKGDGGDIALSPLQVKATFAGKQIPNSPVDMTLSANTRVNMDQQTLVIDNMSLNGLGLDVKSNLNAKQILDKPTFSGDLAVAEFNLRKFAQQLNQPLPVTADKNVFNKVAVKTGLSGSTDSINLKDLLVKLDETELRGDLSVNRFSQPDINFGIGIDSINADRYLPPEAKGKPVTPETVAGGAASEIPLDTLRSLRVKGDLVIGQLVISHAKMSNIKLSIRAKDGDIRLDPVAADLYQGKYQGNVALDAKGKVPNIVINTQLAGVQLEPLMKDYMQQPESPLVGVANITLSPLTASGSDATKIKSSMNGKGSFSVKDGILRGVDVNKTLEQVEIMIESKRFGNLDTAGNTPFQKLDGTLDIKGGVVTNQDMLMDANGFTLRGKGMLANLNDETIKYNMKVKVDERRTSSGEEQYNIGGYELPVKCRGQLSKPDCKPDVDDIAKVLFKKTGEEKLKELLGDTLGGGAKESTTQTQPTTTTAPTTTTQEKTTTETQQQTQPESAEDQLKDEVKGLLKGLFD